MESDSDGNASDTDAVNNSYTTDYMTGAAVAKAQGKFKKVLILLLSYLGLDISAVLCSRFRRRRRDRLNSPKYHRRLVGAAGGPSLVHCGKTESALSGDWRCFRGM